MPKRQRRQRRQRRQKEAEEAEEAEEAKEAKEAKEAREAKEATEATEAKEAKDSGIIFRIPRPPEALPAMWFCQRALKHSSAEAKNTDIEKPEQGIVRRYF